MFVQTYQRLSILLSEHYTQCTLTLTNTQIQDSCNHWIIVLLTRDWDAVSPANTNLSGHETQRQCLETKCNYLLCSFTASQTVTRIPCTRWFISLFSGLLSLLYYCSNMSQSTSSDDSLFLDSNRPQVETEGFPLIWTSQNVFNIFSSSFSWVWS